MLLCTAYSSRRIAIALASGQFSKHRRVMEKFSLMSCLLDVGQTKPMAYFIRASVFEEDYALTR